MAIARFLDCMYLALEASGLRLRYATKFDPFISLDCASRPPPRRNPRIGSYQILPSGNLGQNHEEVIYAPPRQEGVRDGQVPLDGDGDGAVHAPHQPDVCQGKHVREDEDPESAVVFLVELGYGKQQNGADDVDLE